ncbi:hypothetical protein [Rossellomorea marisflavi]|uniref:hypothetical protein n=1 Tax=Rossellomorea marisflavi TaxID=189381 RepID=UPI003517C0B1
MEIKQTSEVFGISNTILNDSYIDRGDLDQTIQRYLNRNMHIAVRGESKCGKSWFRQRNIPEAIVVQCRFGKSVRDIYIDALSQLDIKLTLEETKTGVISGTIEAQATFGAQLLAKLGVKSIITSTSSDGKKTEVIGKDVNDLKFIADIINESGKRLVIEDFHYLSVPERKAFSYDLKALWDYGCFVIIIGVWSQSNMLLYLNSDLTGRIYEMSIYWSLSDLNKVLEKGSKALKVTFSAQIIDLLSSDCFGNVGILQTLALKILDVEKVFVELDEQLEINKQDSFNTAAAEYAGQLDSLYQQFATRVSAGIRSRGDSTGIYAHAMAVIVDASDEDLTNGLKLNEIFSIANSRQPRIQKGNLRTILNKLESLQVDSDGRGLVIAYNNSSDEISVVDRQFLFYRKHLTMNWPWNDMIDELQVENR